MLSYMTGANGFLGSHLQPKLKGDVVPIPHDLIAQTALQPFDYFFFLSSYGNLATQTDEFETYRANITDLLDVLENNQGHAFKCFVYISSSSVMLKQQTVYSRAKRAAEEILLAHMEHNDLPVCVIRPFSVTGVGEQENHLIPTLLRAAMTGDMVRLVPDATHDFIDVEDAVEGIASLAEHKARGIYQLGTGIKTTNLDVLRLVEEVTEKKIAVTMVDSMRPYDNTDWVSTNFKARSFGWLPRKTLKETIKEMWGAMT